FRFDAVDGDFEGDMLMLFLGFGDFRIDGAPDELSSQVCARSEWRLELDAEPDSKFHGVGQGAPDAFERGTKKNPFLDAVGRRWFLYRLRHGVMQPPGCILTKGFTICNRRVARFTGVG